MPFYLNFVDDSLLNKVPDLKKFSHQKLPRFKVASKVIPQEEDIRERYTYTIPTEVAAMENPNSSMHILEKP